MNNVRGREVQLDDAFLDRMRHTIDPPADAAAKTLDEPALRLIADLMKKRQMWDADGEPSAQLPESIRAYMKEASRLPDWADQSIIAEAEQFFLLYGLASSTLLACASLPQCYVMKYGTEVLSYTKFLQVHPTRRIRETAQMVMDVMVPGGLKPGGRGVRATMKVRVMHAIVRRMFMDDRGAPHPVDADQREKFGLPINQEDMVYTLMTFSYVVIEGFRKMGYELTGPQREGYIHCWNVVGCLMGISEELLPATFADAQELFDAIQRRQHGQSEAGVKLTQALIQAVQEALPGEHHDSLVPALVRRLVGDATADTLGVAPPGILQRARLDLLLAGWADAARGASKLHGDRLARSVSARVHHAIMIKIGGMGGAAFEVPEEFLAQWFPDGLPDPPAPPAAN